MNKIISAFLLSATVIIASCGPKSGFQSADQITDGGQQGGLGDGKDPNPTETPSWEKVDVDGYSSGLDFEGQLVVKIDKQNQALLLILPIPAFLFLPFTAKIEIPELEGAFFTSYKNSKDEKQLAISIPLTHVLKGAQFLPDQKLPNGDPLPFVPAGELPGFAIQFPQNPDYRVHLYVGVNVAAAFLELPDIDLPINTVVKVKNSAKTKDVGAIGYIAPKATFDGGLYLAAQIPDKVAVMIDELIRW